MGSPVVALRLLERRRRAGNLRRRLGSRTLLERATLCSAVQVVTNSSDATDPAGEAVVHPLDPEQHRSTDFGGDE